MLTKENDVVYSGMKEMILLLILSSLAARLNAANQIEDLSVQAFAKRMAYKESNRALRSVL